MGLEVVGPLIGGLASGAGTVSQLTKKDPMKQVPQADMSVPQAPPVMPLPSLGTAQVAPQLGVQQAPDLAMMLSQLRGGR